jgi:hypothetical protein
MEHNLLELTVVHFVMKTARSSSLAGPLHIKDTPKGGNNLSAQQPSNSHKEPVEDNKERNRLVGSIINMQRNLTSNFPCHLFSLMASIRQYKIS